VVELAYALSGNRAGAEDIAQEAFLRAHRDRQRVGRYRYPGAWVRRAAANLATSAVRRQLIEARALARVWARQEPALAGLPASEADFRRAAGVGPGDPRRAGPGGHRPDLPDGHRRRPDGHLYVSEYGYGPDPTAGRILQVRLR
jgi:RNA polymerase sigma-70 factor (ECF subfamily)